MTLTALPGFTSGAVLARNDVVREANSVGLRREVLLSEEHPWTAELAISSDETIVIETQGPAPEWLLYVLHDLQSISLLGSNWDGYAAKKISGSAILASLQFLAEFLPKSGRKPSIVPTPRGGLQLEWHQAGADIEVCISHRGNASVYYHINADGELWEGDLTSRDHATRLRQILASM